MSGAPCPHCGTQLTERDLRRDAIKDAPRKFGLALPRSYCPQCGTPLRSNTRSFLAYTTLTGTGLLLIIVISNHLPPPLSTALKVAGGILMLLAGYTARRVHRWRIAAEAAVQSNP